MGKSIFRMDAPGWAVALYMTFLTFAIYSCYSQLLTASG